MTLFGEQIWERKFGKRSISWGSVLYTSCILGFAPLHFLMVGLLVKKIFMLCVVLYKQMLKKLSKQLSGEDWTWNNLNTLCWAIGSISGSMMEEQVGFASSS